MYSTAPVLSVTFSDLLRGHPIWVGLLWVYLMRRVSVRPFSLGESAPLRCFIFAAVTPTAGLTTASSYTGLLLGPCELSFSVVWRLDHVLGLPSAQPLPLRKGNVSAERTWWGGGGVQCSHVGAARRRSGSLVVTRPLCLLPELRAQFSLRKLPCVLSNLLIQLWVFFCCCSLHYWVVWVLCI